MVVFLVLTATTFSLFGFVIGVWAKGFEQLQFIPMLIIAPLTFLGGAFYSIDMLPEAWRTFSLFQSGCLPDQRFPLELLWKCRRRRRHQPRDDAGIPIALPCRGVADLYDGIPAQELSTVVRLVWRAQGLQLQPGGARRVIVATR